MSLPRSISRTLAAALWWIAAIDPLVPQSRRATWRDQWRGELWHYAQWLSREPAPPPSMVLRLAWRAAGALPHALVLGFSNWSAQMILHDIRFAWRMLVRRPAFSAIAVVILGLGIGANATIFSWVESTLLQPLPGVRDQQRLVSFRGTIPSRSDLSFSYLNYRDLRDARPAGVEDVIAFRGLAMNLRAGAEPVRIWGELVTPNFFDVLRVAIVEGRDFTEQEGSTPGRDPVAVISHRLWQRTFGGERSAIGRGVSLNGHQFTIIGVAGPEFQGSLAGVSLDVFIPITMQKAVLAGDRLPQRGNSWLQVFGRLTPDGTLEEVQTSASTIAARLASGYPENENRGIRIQPLWRDGASGMLLPVMATLMAVVGVVLLIACANLAGLLLARAAGRQREVAVRLAVGASRGRLVRQFLLESLLLASAGGAAGVALSFWTAGMLSAFIPRTPVPIGFTAGVSPTVLAFSTAVTFVAAIVFGLLPAIRASRPDVASTLKDAAGSVAGGARGRLRQALVVAQVALSLLLLVAAALFARSLGRAQVMDPGFTLRHGLIASLDLLPNGYGEARGIAFDRQLLDRLGALARIESVTLATAIPLNIFSVSDMEVDIEGYQPKPDESITAYYNRVAPRYFETMGIPIVEGRAIDARDVEGRELSVVVNETMARRYWRDGKALGRIVRFGSGPARVVGIARDGKYGRLNETPRNYMYVPLYQYYSPDVALIVRTAGGLDATAAAIQAEIRGLDPGLPLFDVRSVRDHMQFSTFVPRLATTLLALFGLLALLLAAVGLYGVVAYTVVQRTREIGVRMALGASRTDVLRMVMRQGIRVTSIGLGIGLLLALAAARVLSGQLVGISGTDPVSFAGTAVALFVIALAACALPARRAASLDPLRAIRHD